MKRTKVLSLTLLAAAALTFTGCDDEQQQKAEVQACVDQNNAVQDESYCVNQDAGGYWTWDNYGHHIFHHYYGPSFYHWYYGGYNRYNTYQRGVVIYGGHLSPTPGYSSLRSSVVIAHGGSFSSGHVSFGGFGSTGGGHAGFGGAGE